MVGTDARAYTTVHVNYMSISRLLKQGANLELILFYYFFVFPAFPSPFAAMAFETVSSTINPATSNTADRQLGRGMVQGTLYRPALMAGRGRLGRAGFPVMPTAHVAEPPLPDEACRSKSGVTSVTRNIADRSAGRGIPGRAEKTMSQRFCGNFGYCEPAGLVCACAPAGRPSQLGNPLDL